jgi:hypothetical protein
MSYLIRLGLLGLVVAAGCSRVAGGASPAPAFLVSSGPRLITSEAGGTASFSVRLSRRPVADVRVAVASSNEDEGRPETKDLVFTALDWDQPHRVTVRGVDDFDRDGDRAYSVLLLSRSRDRSFHELHTAPITVHNLDDDRPTVLVSASGLLPASGDGAATFSVSLSARPRGEVQLRLANLDPQNGRLSQQTLRFSPHDWASSKTVVVTGAPDPLAGEARDARISLEPVRTEDPDYAGIDPADVTVTFVEERALPSGPST